MESVFLVRTKVWLSYQSEPPDGTATWLTTAPRNWFEEPPEYAAELFMLEHFHCKETPTTTVYVRDPRGKLHEFKCCVSLQPEVFIRRTGI